jgi:hypothetical protein
MVFCELQLLDRINKIDAEAREECFAVSLWLYCALLNQSILLQVRRVVARDQSYISPIFAIFEMENFSSFSLVVDNLLYGRLSWRELCDTVSEKDDIFAHNFRW